MGAIDWNDKEHALILLLKQGDALAFRKLYDQYYNLVYKYSLLIIKSNEMAEEAVQEVFTRVWEKRESINSTFSFKAYLCTIAKNYLLNQLRKASYDASMRQHVFYSRAQSEPTTENLILEKELESIKQTAIDSLPPQRKKIFLLCHQQGMKHKDIATLLGISQHTVKDQIVKANKDIKGYLTEHAGIAFSLLLSLFSDC